MKRLSLSYLLSSVLVLSFTAAGAQTAQTGADTAQMMKQVAKVQAESGQVKRDESRLLQANQISTMDTAQKAAERARLNADLAHKQSMLAASKASMGSLISGGSMSGNTGKFAAGSDGAAAQKKATHAPGSQKAAADAIQAEKDLQTALNENIHSLLERLKQMQDSKNQTMRNVTRQ